MAFAKELLLFCIVIMHSSIMASQQLDLEKLGNYLKTELSWCNLLHAERLYVDNIFNKKWPIIKKVEALKGITIPVGNSTEIRTSICAINDYLGVHLPPIIRNLTIPTAQKDIIRNVTAFRSQFKYAVELSGADPTLFQLCHRNVSPADMYEMKEIGFRIIHNTKLWVKNFTKPTTRCGSD